MTGTAPMMLLADSTDQRTNLPILDKVKKKPEHDAEL
jgi:hypothetical protein